MPAKTSTTERLSEFESPDDSPGFLLWQVASLWQRNIRAALQPFDLTHAQFVLLVSAARLENSNEEVTQVRLATHAKTDIMMTSKVLRTLEQKGLIKREPHTTDTRANSIHVTQKGRALAQQTIQIVEQADAAFFGALGAQLPGFNASLLKILAQRRALCGGQPQRAVALASAKAAG